MDIYQNWQLAFCIEGEKDRHQNGGSCGMLAIFIMGYFVNLQRSIFF